MIRSACQRGLRNPITSIQKFVVDRQDWHQLFNSLLSNVGIYFRSMISSNVDGVFQATTLPAKPGDRAGPIGIKPRATVENLSVGARDDVGTLGGRVGIDPGPSTPPADASQLRKVHYCNSASLSEIRKQSEDTPKWQCFPWHAALRAVRFELKPSLGAGRPRSQEILESMDVSGK